MTSMRSKLQEDTHFRVLRILQENPEMSQRELAAAVGVSVGGVHYVLNALIDAGLVKLGNFTAAEDRRRYAYVLTPKGIARKATLTRAFLVRKVEEYEALKEEIEALQVELDAKYCKEAVLIVTRTHLAAYFWRKNGEFLLGQRFDACGIHKR